MEEIMKVDSSAVSSPNAGVDTGLIEAAAGILTDARTGIPTANTFCIPITQLATLGAGVAPLIPAFRTVTQTVDVNTSGLYRLANEAIGDTLKVAKNGYFWGAFKTAKGTSKFAQLQSASPLSVSTQSVIPINPATVLMAAALFSMERQIGEIQEAQRSILSFLENEKESEIEADVETLSNILSKYKLSWDNEHFVASNHKLVLDIQRTARKNMLSYQKIICDDMNGKKRIVAQTQFNSIWQEMVKKFKYYRLSLYTFSMASVMEVMLSGNFKEAYISDIRQEIEAMSVEYRNIFDMCSVYLEKLSDTSLEQNVLRGLGSASKAVGKWIGSIPVVKEGPVDELLIDSGTQMTNRASDAEEKLIQAFAALSNPKTRIFLNCLEDFTQIYNCTEQIYFDERNIYLITG